MNSNILKLAIIPFVLIAAMWASSELLVMRIDTRNAILGALVFIMVFLMIARRIPLDIKMVFIVFMGYCIGGRGFAYLSPAPPIFIGEIALAMAVAGFLVREVKGARRHHWTPLHISLFLLLLYSTIHLIWDFPKYKLMAIRDYSMIYYCLYFFVSFALLQKPKFYNIFEKMMVSVLVWGIISRIILNSGLVHFIAGSVWSGITSIYLPHADILIPLNVAGAIYFSVRFSRKRKPMSAILAITSIILVITGKSSGVLAFVILIFILSMLGRLTELWKLLFVTGILAIFAVSVIGIYDSDILVEHVTESEHMQSFNMDMADVAKRGGSTTQWRMLWWGKIWNDTMASNPALGQGWGADISSAFLLGHVANPTAAELAAIPRYPHNMLFTVIGRIGLIGLLLFGIYCILVIRLSLQFCLYTFATGNWTKCDLAAFAFFFAGFINAFTQATYEPPHGAIPHWIALAYMARRMYNLQHGISYDPVPAKS